MILVQLLFLFSVSVLLLTPIEGQGRRPLPIEQSYCNLMFADEIANAKTIDRRATLQAYRVNGNNNLCATNCRIVNRGNIKPLGSVPSPDFIECAPGPQFCYQGNCITSKELAQLLKKTRTTP